MFKRISGIGLLLLLLVAPVILPVPPAEAQPSGERVCYVGTGQFKYGIVLEVTEEQARQLVRKHRAYYRYLCTGQWFQGYEICKPIKGGEK